MTWLKDTPAMRVISNAVELHLRAQRLALVQKLDLAEAQARNAGAPTEQLAQIRLSLTAQSILPKQEAFLELPVPSKVTRQRELQHISVVRRKGSIF